MPNDEKKNNYTDSFQRFHLNASFARNFFSARMFPFLYVVCDTISVDRH